MNVLLRSVDWKEASLGLAIMAGIVVSAFYSYLFFHTFAELYSIIIAFSVFIMAWNTRRFLNNDYLLFVGVCYFFVAFLDLLHTLAYKGMPIFTGFDGNNLPPQIWIVARYLESLSLLAAPLFFRHRLAVGPAFAAYAAVTGLSLLSIFYWRNFPACFVEGSGLTPFKVASEYVICVILAGASWLLWAFRRRFDPLVLRFLILSLAATVATELCFTAYTNLYAAINLVGHLFKILSFYFMYRAIIETGLRKPYDLLFRDLQMEIEERAKAEQALLRSRELLDRTQKAGGTGGFEWDWETNALTLTGQSRLLLQIPKEEGFTLDGLFGRIAPEDRLSLMEAFHSARETGQPLDIEARLGLPDGERWLRFAGGLANHGGRSTLAGVMQDITDKKNLERLREDIDRMSRHDLKSPLNAIIGLPGLILSDPDMPREEIDGYLRLVRQTGYKMLDLINISLDMFKMEQGTYEFVPKPVDLAALAEKLGQEAAGKLKSRRLRLLIVAGGDDSPGKAGPFTVQGEELPCWSMLGNLLENAIQASPPEGTVRIRMERDKATGRISISNTGTVPEDMRSRFFEKYATSGKAAGTGLGTYSARLIARTLGGSIALDTSDPEGTTVTVTLPMAD